jgi:hypothetical protein
MSSNKKKTSTSNDIKDFRLNQIEKNKKYQQNNEIFNIENITSIRNEKEDFNDVPYNIKMINYLKSTRKKLTSTVAFEVLGIDHLPENQKLKLLEGWRTNPKIEFISTHYEEAFEFKPVYKVKDIKELTQLISENPDGILLKHLLESYDKVQEDVEELKKEQKIYEIKHSDTEKLAILYPFDEKCQIEMDEEIKLIWKSKDVQVLKDNIQRDMLKYKIKEMKIVNLSDSKRKMDELGKKKKDSKRNQKKDSNTHLKHKFDFSKIWTKQGPPK